MPSTKSKRILGRDVVHIKVGEDEQDFVVHKELICHHSPYFRAAFTSGFEETRSGVMKLPETSVEVFEIFYHWLYYQLLFDSAEDKQHWPKQRTLFCLHVFADMARIPRLMNECVRALEHISNANRELDPSSFNYVWENTTTENPLRRYVRDAVIWECGAGFLDKAWDDLPTELLKDLLMSMHKELDMCKDQMPKWFDSQRPLTKLGSYQVAVDEEDKSSKA